MNTLNAETKTDSGQSLLTDGLGAWVRATDRMPTEDETIGGRVPVLDADGYLVFGLLICGRLHGTSDIDVEWWLPVQAPNVQIEPPSRLLAKVGSNAGLAPCATNEERKSDELDSKHE